MPKHETSWSETIALACAVAVAAIGSLVLVGWFFNIPGMTSVLPGLVSMKANTSVCFILSGLALAMSTRKERDTVSQAIAISFCAIVFAVGAATLFEYASGIDLGIDQILTKESSGAVGTLDPGRMAPSTALCFILAGTALALTNTKKYATAAQSISFVVAYLGLLNFIGYAYDIKAMYSLSRFTQMALHTTIAFMLLGTGSFIATPESGLASALCAKGIGSSVARRLVPVGVIFPVVIGYFMIQLEKSGAMNLRLGSGLIVFMCSLLITIAILLVARLLNLADTERTNNIAMLRETTGHLAVAAEEWSNTFDAIDDLIFLQDNEYTITNANRAFCGAMKLQKSQITGKKCYELMHNDSHPWPNCPMKKTKQDGKTHTEQVDDPHIGALLLVTTSPLKDKMNNIVGSVHIARNITENKKIEDALRASELRYKLLYESSKDAIMTLDPDKGFLSGNRATLELFACKTEAQFTSQTPASLSPEYQPDGEYSRTKASKMIKTALDQGSNYFEWKHKKLNDEEFDATVLLTRIDLEGKTMLQATVRDTTKQKELEKELKRRIENLEKFQKITVDRELRMKELKSRVAELENDTNKER